MSELLRGSWNAICDRCGFKFKAYKLREEWTGSMVCKDCWEPRHPQDLIKIPKDDQQIPWARPEPADVFITVTPVSAGTGTQGGAVPDGTFTTNNETL